MPDTEAGLHKRLELLVRKKLDAAQETNLAAVQSEIEFVGQELGFAPDEIADIERVIAGEKAVEHLDPGAKEVRLTAITRAREFRGEFKQWRWDLQVPIGWFGIIGAVSLYVHRDVPQIGIISLTIAIVLFVLSRAGVRRFRVEGDGTIWIQKRGRFEPLAIESYSFGIYNRARPAAIMLFRRDTSRFKAKMRGLFFPFRAKDDVFIFLGHWRRVSDKAYLVPDILTVDIAKKLEKKGLLVEPFGKHKITDGEQWIARRTIG
jgi:hypothetical protein